VTPPLFLLDPLPPGAEVDLDGSEGRHAATVRRLGVGEALTLGDGHGGLLDCVVAQVRQGGLRLAVLARRTVAAPRPRLVVVQALAKGDRAELAVELLTELGVDEIVPWAASRSIVQWQGDRGERARQRWSATAREAAKQSRRAWLPLVTELADTAGVIARLGGASRLPGGAAGPAIGLVLHEAATLPLVAVAADDLLGSSEVLLVVGPEGGVSEDELAGLTAAGGRPVRLGEPVLRTSTAGAAALAALAVRLGRWG
jgi:16S rRNA (uracil1498-N3)-methyltransferase